MHLPYLLFLLKIENPGVVFVFATAIGLIYSFILTNKTNTKIDEEVEFDFLFNSRWHNLTKDNLMVAYIRLAALLIDDDRSDAGKKVIYMNKYFIRYFPDNQIYFSETFSHALHNKVRLSSVGSWLNRKLPSKKDRLQIMYFLAGVTKIDGNINSRELKTLQNISDLLELTPKEFKTILGIYNQKEKANTRRPSKSTRRTACDILGVSELAQINEIKKAYRNLVKIHHPDRFYNESEQQQNIAEERFLAIQKAYETLEKTH